MAAGTHSHTEMTAGAQLLLERHVSGVSLRPLGRSNSSPESSEDISGTLSQPSGRGFPGDAAADFYFPDRDLPEGLRAEHERLVPQNDLGAMRGFMFVLGLYMAMAAMGLGGLLIWHWLR